MSEPQAPNELTERDQQEVAALRDVAAFKPNARPMLIAVGLNVLLGVLFLGAPYYRGKSMARDSLRASAELSACILGAKALPDLGLSLPAADRSHFAEQALHADAKWPGRCLSVLPRVVPEEAIFLWPSVKTAIGDVRAAAGLVEREVQMHQRARSAGVARVPERPLLALGKLQAALTLLARAAGVSDTLDAPAVSFADSAPALDPSRVPIMAAETAVLELWLRPDGLEAIALDSRGVSWLHVADGKIDRSRVKRTSLLRGAVREGDDAYAIFAMPKARCDEDEHRCVRRATGIAQLVRDATEPPKPQWLGGHPAGRFDRSVRIAREHFDVLTRATQGGALELRRFARVVSMLPAIAAPSDAESDQSKPQGAIAQWSIAEEGDKLDALLEPEPASATDAVARVLLARAHEGSVSVERLDPAQAAAPLQLGNVAGTTPWVSACARGDRVFVAFGSERALSLVQVSGATVEEITRRELEVGAPLHDEAPLRDRVRLLCDGSDDKPALFVLDERHALRAYACNGAQCAWQTIEANVAAFDATRAEDKLVVALSRTSDPTVVVTTLDGLSAPTPLRTLAGCWDPPAGMCGAPALASDPDSGRIVLAAREGADLRVLESADGGASFRALLEMQTGLAPLGDPSAPMQQHRLRKGLEQ